MDVKNVTGAILIFTVRDRISVKNHIGFLQVDERHL
jgi:hypothetical protein